MSTLIRYIPTSYTLYSRISGINVLLSWIYLFPLYCFLVIFFYGTSLAFVAMPFIYLAVISIYEIGYFYNDMKVVDFEINPTRRVKDAWYFDNFKKLVLSRVLFTIISLIFVRYILGVRFLFDFILSLLVLAAAFSLHNALRGKANVLTFSFLSFMKYFCMIFVTENLVVVMMTYFSFSFLRTIENASTKGYISNSEFISKNLDSFRVFYYIPVFLISCSLAYFSILPVHALLIPAYFLLFRLLILFLPKSFLVRS